MKGTILVHMKVEKKHDKVADIIFGQNFNLKYDTSAFIYFSLLTFSFHFIRIIFVKRFPS